VAATVGIPHVEPQAGKPSHEDSECEASVYQKKIEELFRLSALTGNGPELQ